MSESVMSERSTEQIRELLDSLYRVDSGRILATLIRLLTRAVQRADKLWRTSAGTQERAIK